MLRAAARELVPAERRVGHLRGEVLRLAAGAELAGPAAVGVGDVRVGAAGEPGGQLVSRSSVVGAPGEVLIVTFGCAVVNSAASSSASFSASAVWPVHQVMVTVAFGS